MGLAAAMARVEVTAVQDSRRSCDLATRSWFVELAVVLEEAHASSCRWSED